MPCCSLACPDTGRFFSHLARLDRWRYRLFGLERSQRQISGMLQRLDIRDAELLEIGCGIGYLHQALLQGGAARAAGIDLSERMLEEAGRAARAAGLGGRTCYRQGDFVELADTLAPADITILDKVVCCYPDPERLLTAALSITRRAIALSYPRDRLTVRAGIAILSGLLRLGGCAFRPYLHDPGDIERWIRQAGFRRHDGMQTMEWSTEVYVKAGSPA